MKKLRLSQVFPFREELQRLLRIMRLTVLLLVVATLQLSANVYSQKASFTVEFKNSNMEDLMTEIKKNSEFDFVYSLDEVEGVSINNASFVDSKIYEILDECLAGTSIDYKIVDKVIILTPKEEPSVIPVQEEVKIKLTGKVTDSEGQPLPGVNVYEKSNPQHGVITDFDGLYSIELDDKETILVFSFIGFDDQEIIFNGQTMLNVTLTDEEVGLGEVMVVAYGTTKKTSFTGSASVVDGEAITKTPVTSFEKALTGNTTGVQVASMTGQPGSASEIRIRGMGSINASNSPLYVIDGVPVTSGSMNSSGSSEYSTGNVMSSINPNDIASVTVLKDAAAASLYGSRAANGVIIITTKQGKSGKTKFSFNAYHGVTDFAVDNYKPASGEEYLELVLEGLDNKYGEGSSSYEKYRDRYNWYEPKNGYTDWEDLMFDKGSTDSYELSATGGSDKTTFYISGSLFDQKGMAVNSYLKRLSGRINLTHKVNDKVKIGVNALTAHTEQRYVRGGSYYSNPF